jgi:galactitol-specific phosphotransferase system IIB component
MKNKSLLAVICILATAASISTALLGQHTAWSVYKQTAFAQTVENINNNNTATNSTTTQNIQQWEKYDFIITSPELAAKLGVSPNTELNVKILSNSSSVEDMRQAILDSFKTNNTTEADKSSIQILGTLSDVICAQ